MTDVPVEDIVGTLAEMRQSSLIRHIGLSSISADQLRTATAITDIAAVTVQYNVTMRQHADVQRLTREAGIVLSPWHPGGLPQDGEGDLFHAVITPVAAAHHATPRQVALAWRLHRGPQVLPTPGTTRTRRLEENLAAARIRLSTAQVDAIARMSVGDARLPPVLSMS
ncbi:aldo/keto reductase [Streptomyces sp. NPDC097727]|uniref:aldo/keto reductase n=1 Tax=Streptomyces sp. NPDC097727 TaxID=3366092 RepID=UPI0037F36D4F